MSPPARHAQEHALLIGAGKGGGVATFLSLPDEVTSGGCQIAAHLLPTCRDAVTCLCASPSPWVSQEAGLVRCWHQPLLSGTVLFEGPTARDQ
jgi:hypothetical protein